MGNITVEDAVSIAKEGIDRISKALTEAGVGHEVNKRSKENFFYRAYITCYGKSKNTNVSVEIKFTGSNFGYQVPKSVRSVMLFIPSDYAANRSPYRIGMKSVAEDPSELVNEIKDRLKKYDEHLVYICSKSNLKEKANKAISAMKEKYPNMKRIWMHATEQDHGRNEPHICLQIDVCDAELANILELLGDGKWERK